MKSRRRRPLVVANQERLAVAAPLAQPQWQFLPLVVTGQIVGRIADGDQRLLEQAAHPQTDAEHPLRQPLAQQRRHLAVASQQFRQRRVGDLQHQSQSRLIAFDHRQSVAPAQRLDLLGHALGHRIFGVLAQGGDHRPGIQTRCPGVPDAQRGNAVGMDVLRTLDQFGKGRDGVASRLGAGRMHFQQHGLIALHDQRIFGEVIAHLGRL